MSFLFPLYILGAAAIALPILLHLRRRPPKEHQTFSSLMFLEKSPERLTRRTKIERWLLLALRCLALILLALMFGRPFLKSSALDLSAGEGSRVIVLIDRSASMRRDDLWTRALAEARVALENTAAVDDVAVALFDDRLEVTRPFSSLANLPGAARFEALEQTLKSDGEQNPKGGPSWRGTNLGEALTQAADLIADAASEREATDQRIVVISDFQEGAARDSLNRYAWPEDVVVQPFAVAATESPGNLALHLVASSRDSGESEAREGADGGIRPPRRRVRITNGRDSDSETFSLSWQGAADTRIDGFLPAGASRVMPVPPRPDESSDAVLEISGDDQDFDNRVYVARAQPRQVNILYLGKEASAEDVGSPLFYLNRAMHRTSTIDPSVDAIAFEALAAEPDKIDAAQVIVVRTDGDSPIELAERLARKAERGNMVIGIVNEGTEAVFLQELTGIGDLTLSEAEVRNYAMLAEIDFEHPVLIPFAQAKIRDFTKIHTWRHRVLTVPDSSVEDVRVLAKYDSGSPAWIEIPKEAGKVVLFLSGWEPRESQLALSSKFVPLIYGLLGQAGFSALAEPTRYVGDPLPIPTNETEVEVVSPEGAVVTPEGQESKPFTGTEVPGFYTVRSRDALGDEQARVHAVNLPPDESRVETIDPVVALREFGVKVDASFSGAAAISQAQSATDELTETQRRRIEAAEKENNQKLWKWLLVAALAILVLETWLAGKRPVRLPTASNP